MAMEINSIPIIAALLVGLVFPAYAMLSGRKLKEMLIADPGLKTVAFKSTAALLIFLAVISLLPFWVTGSGMQEIGLGFLTKPLPVILLLLIPGVLLWAMRFIPMRAEQARSVKRQYSEVFHLMPAT